MTVYTTGADLLPIKIGELWFWLVVGFQDDTFHDGEFVNVTEYSENKVNLIREGDDTDD